MTDTTETRRWLAEIPELCALLPDALNTRVTGDHTRRPVPSSRPPVGLDIVDLTDTRHKHDWLTDSMAWCDPQRMGVLPYLDSWARDLEATAVDGDPVFGIQPRHEPLPPAPDPPTVAGCCDWLADILDWAETLPQWPELADGITVMHRRLRAATASVRDREERPVPCPTCGEPLRREGTQSLWSCPSGHEVTVQAVTINQAAKIIGIPKDQLYTLVNRPALLKEIDSDPLRPILSERGSRKLYDLNDIRRLVAEVRLRRLA